jgi:hypothetical protein
MRRSPKRRSTGAKSLASAAGNAIGNAAIAATRAVIRKARTAVQSTDRALFGAAPGRRRATTKPGAAKLRTGKRAKKVRGRS